MRWHRHLFAATLLLRHPETGDILLESLEDGRSLISIKKTETWVHCTLSTSNACFNWLRHCPEDVWYWKSACIECPAKESTESSGRLGCTFWSHCWTGKHRRCSVLWCQEVYTLTSLKNKQNRVMLINFWGKIQPGHCYSSSPFFINFWPVF